MPPIPPASSASLPQLAGERKGVFSQHLLHRVNLKVALSQKLLELKVLTLKLSESAQVICLKASVFSLPDIEGVLADAVVAAQLCLSLLPALRFAENADDLLF